MLSLFTRKTEKVAADEALRGREEQMSGLGQHRVLSTTITPPFPEGTEQAIFGMGCFWGADRPF
jgi:peptide-methionine (S)-S-oxide reductase